MKVWTSAVSIVALLRLVVADCDNFDFTGSNEGVTTTYNTTFRTSAWVNCTQEIAIQDGARRNSCEVHNPSTVGLVVHPQIDFPQVNDDETRRDIFSLVREKASASALAVTNFNSTIVMNFTSDGTFYPPIGQAGHSAFTPTLRCWDGVLSDCDDDDNLEGKATRVCGLAWLDSSDSQKPLGQQKYDGIENFVQTDLGAGSPDPPPSYDSVADQATNDQEGSASMIRVGSAALLVALLCSVYGFLL
ncbi:hypothetical protein F5Y13DRAFT_91144 [Hypoxylon sp. FL1857]|nr:hypothetical protein F5Y13DRAFT_91144 [Hypoxylon sp. FL1857]